MKSNYCPPIPRINRLASLQAVDKVLGTLKNSTSAKNDALVENRVWINCFSSDESMSEEARNVWKTLIGGFI